MGGVHPLPPSPEGIDHSFQVIVFPYMDFFSIPQFSTKLMNNSKSGRQDIYSSVASERRDKKIQNAKPQKKLRKRERGLKVGNHYNVNSQCLQLSGILPVEGDGSFALMINLSGEISWHTCHTRFRFYFQVYVVVEFFHEYLILFVIRDIHIFNFLHTYNLG